MYKHIFLIIVFLLTVFSSEIPSVFSNAKKTSPEPVLPRRQIYQTQQQQLISKAIPTEFLAPKNNIYSSKILGIDFWYPQKLLSIKNTSLGKKEFEITKKARVKSRGLRTVPGWLLVQVIPYNSVSRGWHDWILTKAIKDLLTTELNCNSLKKAGENSVYMPVDFSKPNNCFIKKNKHGEIILYAIGHGFPHEGVPFLESTIVILQDQQAIIFSNLLENLNREVYQEIDRNKLDFAFHDKEFDKFYSKIGSIVSKTVKSRIKMKIPLNTLKKIAESIKAGK